MEFRDDSAKKKANTAWLKQRAKTLSDRVEAAEVLRIHHFDLKFGGSRPESFSCPFHGADRKPSARYHPKESGVGSHVWCFVCQEQWNSVTLWRKFNGDGDTKQGFSRSLTEMERRFGIPTPPMPKVEDIDAPDETDPVAAEVQKLIEICDMRLRDNRSNFEMVPFLTLCVVLDRLHRNYRIGRITPEEARKHLRRVIDKIGEKIRCRVA